MQFKVQYTEYSKEGALTNIVHSEYFATADAAEVRFNDLNRIYWMNDDGTKSNIKRYKVELFVQSYKKIDNPVDFFEQF